MIQPNAIVVYRTKPTWKEIIKNKITYWMWLLGITKSED